MDARSETQPTTITKHGTTAVRKSERELVITRTINGPVRLVFEAWTNAEHFKQWWVPKSMGMTLASLDWDVRTGGKYRLVFKYGDSEPVAFHGKFLEVIPNSRIVWTNEESGETGQVSTVTFEEKAGKTLITLHELYPSKEALEAELASGAQPGTLETFAQLDEFVTKLLAAT